MVAESTGAVATSAIFFRRGSGRRPSGLRAKGVGFRCLPNLGCPLPLDHAPNGSPVTGTLLGDSQVIMMSSLTLAAAHGQRHPRRRLSYTRPS